MLLRFLLRLYRRARYRTIVRELNRLEMRCDMLRCQWNDLKVHCTHERLPQRDDFEEHCDTCPDCGYCRYLYHA